MEMPYFLLDMLSSMKKVRVGGGAVLLLCVLLCFSNSIGYGDDDENEEQRKKSSLWVWERLRSAYSIYSSLFPATNIGNYWHIVKAFLSHAYAFFFPPNIERGNEGEAVAENGDGAGEKVKEAVAKSIGKSKATLENVAKSAANIAKDKVVNNKKTSLSQGREREHQSEL